MVIVFVLKEQETKGQREEGICLKSGTSTPFSLKAHPLSFPLQLSGNQNKTGVKFEEKKAVFAPAWALPRHGKEHGV